MTAVGRTAPVHPRQSTMRLIRKRVLLVITVCCLADPVVGAGQDTLPDVCENKELRHGCPCADSTNAFTLVRQLEARVACLEEAESAALATQEVALALQVASHKALTEPQPDSEDRTASADFANAMTTELQSLLTKATQTAANATAAKKATNRRLTEAKDLVGFIQGNFGIGLLAGHGLGEPRVESARLEHGRAVVDRDTTNRGAVVFEYHRFPWYFREGSFGFGAFAMLSSIPDDLTKVDSFGAGLMFGFRDLLQGKGFLNVGLGIALDRDVKNLAPGFVAGELAPLGAEGKPIEPGLQTKSAYSLFFLISFSPKFGGD